ncbi:DUF3667 domain-containing protein [Aureimonas sp. OT7]|uniref:DUF3667 domain-containing protein n=1 Tax=Aureimonas sp. OT7 TaxID=2816454 RepID=UPI00178533BD|nr:DUF3667 domain-containing protein [Aureimonas sp. OT7]QOG07860.1 DUF3667 domain-containing protein [Aureimonas sp. OT7]
MSDELPAGGALNDSYFEADVCRNCGATLTGPYCQACGQKKADRFGRAHLKDEIWQKLRWFEAEMLKAAFNVSLRPGRVARDYVLGQRKAHVHPLKLLLAAIVILLIVIAQTGYLEAGDTRLSRALELVRAWSKWSFSLGIVAVLIASNLVFRRRQGFNFFEHLVLATYVQFVIIVANIINLSPLLLHTGPDLVARHRQLTGLYMDWVEAGIVFLAFGQFFAVDWRRQWWWPAIGAAVFYVAKEGLLYLYARAVIRIVIAQLR